MEVFYREGYTDIEMESGPYLSAVYEMFRPQRHPVNEIVNLYEVPFDLGIIHYISDTLWGKVKILARGACRIMEWILPMPRPWRSFSELFNKKEKDLPTKTNHKCICC